MAYVTPKLDPLSSKRDHTPVSSVLGSSHSAPCSQGRHVPHILPSSGRFMSVMWIVGQGVLPSHTFLAQGWDRCLGKYLIPSQMSYAPYVVIPFPFEVKRTWG